MNCILTKRPLTSKQIISGRGFKINRAQFTQGIDKVVDKLADVLEKKAVIGKGIKKERKYIKF